MIRKEFLRRVGAGDGRLAVMVRGSDGFAHINRQFVPSGAWSGWSPLSPRAISGDVAAVAGTAIDVFARDAITGRIWTVSADLDGGPLSQAVWRGSTTVASAPATIYK